MPGIKVKILSGIILVGNGSRSSMFDFNIPVVGSIVADHVGGIRSIKLDIIDGIWYDVLLQKM